MNARLHQLAILAALTGLSASTVVAATLEEVIVTAQKREQNLQDVALSLSALSENDVTKLGMQDFRSWADYVPGITMSYGLNSRRGGPNAIIRGVANQVRGGISDNTANSTTAYTIGEVPIFSVSPGLIDMQRIEVLKGPQGTLYGIASMGGVVRYIPNYAETDKFSAKVGVGTGMINSGGEVGDANAMINIPLVEGVLAARVAAVYQYNGGYIDHIFPTLSDSSALVINRRAFDPRINTNDSTGHYLKDTNKSRTVGGRLSMTYTPNERLTVKGFTMWQKGTVDDASQMDVNDPLDLVINRYVLQPQSSEFNLTSLEASYDLGFGSLEYIGGYYENDLMETVDATRMALQYIALNGDTTYPVGVTFPFVTNSQQWTHELRLQGHDKSLAGLSPFGSELKFDYVVGVFYQNEIRSGGYRIAAPDWNANRGPNTRPILTEGGLITGATGIGDYVNKAAFVDLTLHLTDKLSIGAGVRYFDQVKDMDGKGFGVGDGNEVTGVYADDLTDPDFFPDGQSRGGPSQVQNSGTTPRATITYRIDDDRMIYLGAAEGERIAPTAPLAVVPRDSDFNPPECLQLMRDLNLYDPYVFGTVSDRIKSYDLGLKSTWLDKRLLVNASVYHTDWSDLQQAVILNSVNRNCSQVIQANVGEATIDGFELESVYGVTDKVKVNMTLAYADAKMAKAGPGVKDTIGQPLERGDGLIGVPEWTGSFGAEYGFDIPQIPGLAEDYSGYIRADWRYVGERINGFGDRESLRQSLPFNVAESYSMTDVRVGAENGAWSIQAYMSNVFDERAQYESLGNYFQPNIREVAVAQPRTVGLTLSRQF